MGLFSGKLLEKIVFLSGARFANNFEFFGSELLVLAFCVRSVFFGGVSPMFLLYCAGTFSRKLPEKILFLSGARFAKNFGSELLVLAFCVRSVFFGGVSSMFLLYCAGTFSRKLPGKILFLSGARFAKKSGANFWFWPFVSGQSFLVVFRLCFRFIVLEHSPESCLKKISSCQARILQKVSGANFWFWPFVSGRCFWWCFAYVFA